MPKSAMTNIFKAIEELLLSEDSEGCTDDLTVVSREAIEKLRAVYEAERLKR
jgi:hypothetical protein